ncbi:MAG: SDR family NAD(P)-dependent oxidoreductase [Alphaproteobacteria bacterium]|nr:SDR family NAD(P)-dependent oxidoreductase [Alphaproteobacteria bacterium]
MTQTPLLSGFAYHSTAADVIAGIDLTGRRALVTGGYSGIGLETVRALASAGAEIIVPARSPDKARANIAKLGSLSARVKLMTLELSDPASVRRLAEDILAEGKPLHLLINNAGIMATPLARDADGREMQLATNHFGHFLLALRLKPALERAKGARVVALSSIAHRRSAFHFDDWNYLARPYDKWQAYGQSKTANALFAVGLNARGKAIGLRAFSVHPGGIMTDLQRALPREEMEILGWIDKDGTPNPLMKTPEQGAATTTWAATSPKLADRGGEYCEDCDIAALHTEDGPRWLQVSPYAVDPEAAERLWTLSQAETGTAW